MKNKCPAFILICLLFAACSASKKATKENVEPAPVVAPQPAPVPVQQPRPVREQVDTIILALKTKYASCLSTKPDSIRNIKLYSFIDRWLNTPYKWGGMDEKGIDCSAFIQRLFNDVYDIKIPRTSFEQLLAKYVEVYASPKYLAEGDIIFFRTMQDKVVSHVGIYLQNGMFVNSSSSKGVSIASLQTPYWKTKYVACGRINVAIARK
ncbi:C40 family peptidase [Danxiaibacter flavus]|uniref:C40 family peptidase n=1 Tax=Danxiaibacter flavus TaxID=3049108 RepID=A0ABV3ZDX2_9BACT|nr:C40 family peptidase [Chitinophagaceae bacterium DXS]